LIWLNNAPSTYTRRFPRVRATAGIPKSDGHDQTLEAQTETLKLSAEQGLQTNRPEPAGPIRWKRGKRISPLERAERTLTGYDGFGNT